MKTHVALAIAFALTMIAAQVVQAQAYNVIYNFAGGADGAEPMAGLTIDSVGNLYGTTIEGAYSYGTVFELAKSGPGWKLNTLYTFKGADDGISNDGALAYARVIFGPDGALYGTTALGGSPTCQLTGLAGCGTLFKLAPPGTVCLAGPGNCPWTETVIHRFTGIPDGAVPFSEVAFGPHGDLYGTTFAGGINGGCWDQNGCGTVYKLTKTGGVWTQTAHFSFSGLDGAPWAGVLVDSSDYLYGTTDCCFGPSGTNIVFQMAPAGASWTEHTLHTLQDNADGYLPLGNLISDGLGNLYGTTSAGGPNSTGSVFQLDSTGTLHVLYSFSDYPSRGCGPQAGLVMDSQGNLFGTTNCSGAHGFGSVFELKKSAGWQYISLHDFTGGLDGSLPYGGLVFDTNGHLYGTTAEGGTSGYGGVIFEVTP